MSSGTMLLEEQSRILKQVADEILTKERQTKNKNAQELGKLGGEATKKKHGAKHFSRMGKLSKRVKKDYK